MKTLIKPSELNKRFVIIVLLLFTVLALIGLFAGCGNDDNPTGNNNPPVNNEILLFSLDSFNLSGTGYLTKDTIFNFVDTTYDSLKVTFNVNSNCDTLDNSLLNVSFGHAGILYFYRDLNSSYTVYAGKNDSFYFALYSQFHSSQHRYIKASNFKLYLR
jgi:hypothetical protein